MLGTRQIVEDLEDLLIMEFKSKISIRLLSRNPEGRSVSDPGLMLDWQFTKALWNMCIDFYRFFWWWCQKQHEFIGFSDDDDAKNNMNLYVFGQMSSLLRWKSGSVVDMQRSRQEHSDGKGVKQREAALADTWLVLGHARAKYSSFTCMFVYERVNFLCHSSNFC